MQCTDEVLNKMPGKQAIQILPIRSSERSSSRKPASLPARCESLLTTCAHGGNLLRCRVPVAISDVDKRHDLHAEVLRHCKKRLGDI